MSRAERRHRTEAKAERRRRQWSDVMQGEQPPRLARGRVMSYFDCGKTKCLTCSWAKVTGRPRRQDLRELTS